MFDIVMPFVREHMVYLVEALDSIDMQYCRNVILIPAFSADFVDTAIIQEIKNKYVKLKIIYEDGDKSPGLARNMGMAVATAPWIMFF